MSADEPSAYSIALLGFPEVAPDVAVGALCEVFGIDAAMARGYVENTPARVGSNLTPQETQAYIKALTAIGADLSVTCELSGEARFYSAAIPRTPADGPPASSASPPELSGSDVSPALRGGGTPSSAPSSRPRGQRRPGSGGAGPRKRRQGERPKRPASGSPRDGISARSPGARSGGDASQTKAPTKAERPQVSRRLLVLGAIAAVGLLVSLTLGRSSSDNWPTEQFAPLTREDLQLAEGTDAIPSTPAGVALEWALGALSGANELTPSVIEQQFSATTLASISAPELASAIQELVLGGPFALIGFVEPPETHRLLAAVEDPYGGFHQLRVRVSGNAPHRLHALFLRRW